MKAVAGWVAAEQTVDLVADQVVGIAGAAEVVVAGLNMENDVGTAVAVGEKDIAYL